MRWVAAALVAALLGTVTTGCGSRDLASRFGGGEYVALGDSFTSGSGLADARPGTTCQRSAASAYPQLLARRLRMALTDVSCGGSTNDNFGSPQAAVAGDVANPPQGEAVRRSADLVTVGWGYNDLGFYADLMFTCTSLATSDPTGAPCRAASEADGTDLASTAGVIGDRLEATLRQVHDRAPDAAVLLVGYPQLIPGSGTCPELALATGDYPWIRELFERLDDQMAEAAQATGTTYVDLWGPSEGHDICAGEDAWVNGTVPLPGVALTYHPFAAGQEAAAEQVVAALGTVE